jgi:hypothetical protein
VAITDAALAIRPCFAPVQPAGEQKQGRVQSILVRNQPAVEGTPMALEWQRLPWHTTEDDCSHASVMQKNRSTGGIGKSYALPDGDDADASLDRCACHTIEHRDTGHMENVRQR